MLRTVLFIVSTSSIVLFLKAPAQEPETAPPSLKPLPLTKEEKELAPKEVEVEAVTEDVKIAERLRRILDAAGWFRQIEVKVEEGIVFLNGLADSQEHKEWAGQLAGKTQGTVAVINRIDVIELAIWDLTPALEELKRFGREFIRSIPFVVFGLALLAATGFAAKGAMHGLSWLLRPRIKSSVLRNIIAKTAAVLIFIFGLYLILRISGLTRLALTVLGSTGLLGLIIGFAFRDIAENFLASVLLSIRHPFEKGDLIEVAGIEGYVQSINTRSTLLMTLFGNHVQIPNATVYKEKITNLTSNPNTRFDFIIGIGYENAIEEAQSIALDVVRNHPAVTKDPEPLILVDELGAATVNLRVIFWISISRFSRLKVRSAMIRLVKEAFDEKGISMPDAAREILFPQGVPVKMTQEAAVQKEKPKSPAPRSEKFHLAEGELTSEAEDIRKQAIRSREPEAGTDLLTDI